MKQCINCLSENISKIVEKNHIVYYCQNCKNKNARVLDNESQNFEKTEHKLIKHVTVGALIEKSNKILMISRNQFPFGLGIPASHIHYGETVDETLQRLFLDKIKIDYKTKDLVLHQTIVDPCRYGTELHEWYLFKCNLKDVNAKFETGELLWQKKSELSKLNLIPSAKNILTKLGYIENNPLSLPTTKHELKSPRNLIKISHDEESILDNLPISVILFDKNNEINFSNKVAKTLLESMKSNKDVLSKFNISLIDLAKKSMESRVNISSNVKLDQNVYSITANAIIRNNQIDGSTLTIKNITDQRLNETRDLLSYQTSLSLCMNKSCSNIIRSILKQMLQTLDIVGCSLMIKEEDILRIQFRYSKINQKKRKPRELKVGEGVAGWVAEKKTLLAIPDTSRDAMFVGAQKSAEASLLSIPVISNDQVLAVLNVLKIKNHFFSEEETKMASIVANRIALALENDKLYRQIVNEKHTLEVVLSTATDGLILIDKDRKLIFSNPAAKKVVGLTSDEIKNHHINDFLNHKSKENVKKFITIFERALKQKRQISTDFISRKGPEKALRTVFNPIIENDGRCESVLIGFSDITKLKSKEKMIQRQVDQITALFKITSLSISDTRSFLGKILSRTSEILNSEYADIVFENSDKTFQGRKITDKAKAQISKFTTSNAKSYIWNNFKNSLPGLESKTINRTIAVPLFIQKKCIGFLFASNKNTIYNTQDMKLLSIIAGRVSRKLESDNLIQEIDNDRKKTANIINYSGDGIIVLNNNFDAMIWNKAMERITGFKNFNKYLKANPDNNARLHEILKFRTTDKVHEDVKISNSEGLDQWIGITYSFIRNKNKIENIIAVVRDISKEKALETQQKEFVYTSTHELRTPITAIKGYLSMIMNGDAGKVTKRQELYFSRASQSTDRLVMLVEDLLQVARFEENKVFFEKKPFNLQKLTTEVINDFKQKASSKNITLLTPKIDKDLIISGDQERTKQAIANLIDNAIKYTKKKGSVSISAQKISKNRATITISDTGIGIPKKNQALLFNKFYRVPNTESIAAGGTGLGLFIVKNLIEKQGGQIAIESKLGQGTKFLITLPLAKK